MILRNLVIGLLSGFAILLLSNSSQAADASDGVTVCLKCHDRAPIDATAIFKTPHGVKGDSRTPMGQGGCTSCHGDSQAHYQSTPAAGQKRVSPTVVFKGPATSPAEVRNKQCLECHENGLRMDWAGSQHESNQIACNNCHTVHVDKDPVLVKATQPEKCYTCHAARRADAFKFSHHPINEGKVVCADCHNPHGSAGPKLLKEISVNETCYLCHAEKRGPFLWEHEPARDDCTNCHTPHGSNEARLLKNHLPFLCTNCHSEGGHQATPWNGNLIPGASAVTVPALNNNSGAVTAAASARMLDRGCVNCHSNIHGSNSPAGGYFNR